MFGYGRGAMDGFPMDPELPLDIVPVDTSINAILAALAATASQPGVHVLQIGSSHCNPLRARFLPLPPAVDIRLRDVFVSVQLLH